MTEKDKKIIEDSEAAGIPIFVLTAKDACALKAIIKYQTSCYTRGCTGEHVQGIGDRIREFAEWQLANKKRMKLPD